MGEIVIAVNSINDEFAHAFIEVRTNVGIRQIHGEPLGNAFPGGLYSLLGDGTRIDIETRRPPSDSGPYNSITLGENIPDSVLNDVYRDVISAAQRHFEDAQYEVPRLADPMVLSTGHLARSISVGGITISIVPDFFSVQPWGTNPDNGYWGIQNSNTVARWVGEEFVDRLRSLGYDVADLPDAAVLSIGRNLPGWYADTQNLRAAECFPAFTPIAISPSETRPISDIRVGDTVLAFDPAADLGRGALVPRKVVRLYRNTTDEWVKLTWAEGGEQKELIATPGHHFLDRFGSFPTIEEMLQNGRATVVLASGALTEVTAERIIYNAQTAHLFEQAQAVDMIAGKAAIMAVVARKLLSRVAMRKFDRGVAPKYLDCRSWSKSAAAVFLGAAITVTPVHSETGKYFEKWTKSEGFDVGYACNWWKDVPGPESMFEVRKLKSAEILADVDTVEFRMVKPNSAKRTIDSYNGSLFTVRVDREASSVAAIRVVYAFTKNGSCSFIVKAAENSSIAVLRGTDAPNIAASPKALRWIDRSIPECYMRLRRAVDPNILFDCVRSLDPNSTNDQPSEGLWESVMPEGVVPASVARIFIQNRGKTFAVTTFGDTIELVQIGAQP